MNANAWASCAALAAFLALVWWMDHSTAKKRRAPPKPPVPSNLPRWRDVQVLTAPPLTCTDCQEALELVPVPDPFPAQTKDAGQTPAAPEPEPEPLPAGFSAHDRGWLTDMRRRYEAQAKNH